MNDHRRPNGASDASVRAVGKAAEALEYVDRARGHLYSFHQLMGHADFVFEEAADELEDAGHRAEAECLREMVIGRNVLDGRWTFQVVEEFDDLYFEPVRCEMKRLEDELMDGERHVYEAELKDGRRSRGRAGHERRPPAAHAEHVDTDD